MTPSDRRDSQGSGLDRVLIVIPTYDERLNIARIVEEITSLVPEVNILIVDDASPDGTGDVADALAADDDRVHVLHRDGKEGLGKAYIAGFRWALEQDFEFICEMDADGSHRPIDLCALLEWRHEADLVIGSRWVAGGSVVDWPWHRLLLSRAGNLYTRLMLGLRVRDATAGFRVFRRSLLEEIDLDGVESEGYCFQVDMTRRVSTHDGRIIEVPIRFVEREHGASKMSGRIVREALVKVTVWGLVSRASSFRGRN